MSQFRIWLKKETSVDPKVSFSYAAEEGWIGCLVMMSTWEGLKTPEEFIHKVKDELKEVSNGK